MRFSLETVKRLSAGGEETAQACVMACLQQSTMPDGTPALSVVSFLLETSNREHIP